MDHELALFNPIREDKQIGVLGASCSRVNGFPGPSSYVDGNEGHRFSPMHNFGCVFNFMCKDTGWLSKNASVHLENFAKIVPSVLP